MIRVMFDRVTPEGDRFVQVFPGYAWDTQEDGWTEITAENGDSLVSLPPGVILFIQDLDPESDSAT